jgi:pimeloyl-ACP methyl ester carboxylesterase
MNPSTESGFIHLDNVAIHFEGAGVGEPLILLHGLGLNLHVWDDQFATFAERFRVIRYDLRGFGRSLPTTATSFSHVEDLKNLLDQLRIDRAHLLGLSLGGRIATDFALQYPRRVARLVLADAALGGYRFSEDWYARLNAVLQCGKAGDVAAAKALWLAHPLFDTVKARPATGARCSAIANSDADWHWLHQGLEQGLSPAAAKRLGQIAARTLVIVGEHDLADFHAIASLLESGIPHAEKRVIRDAGHIVNMEAPAAFNSTVLAFLSTP